MTVWLVLVRLAHVASLLFAIESGVRIRDSMTVTQKKAYWVMPTGVKEVHYAPVKDINFIGKKRSAVMLASSDFKSSPSPSPCTVSASTSITSSITLSIASSTACVLTSSVTTPVLSSTAASVSAQLTQCQSLCSVEQSPSPDPVRSVAARTSKSPTPGRAKTPSHDETMAFLSTLASCSSKPAILSLIEPYSSLYVP